MLIIDNLINLANLMVIIPEWKSLMKKCVEFFLTVYEILSNILQQITTYRILLTRIFDKYSNSRAE